MNLELYRGESHHGIVSWSFEDLDVIVEINSKACVCLSRSEESMFRNDCTTQSIKANQFPFLLQIQAPFHGRLDEFFFPFVSIGFK